jgi:hypothetical protein
LQKAKSYIKNGNKKFLYDDRVISFLGDQDKISKKVDLSRCLVANTKHKENLAKGTYLVTITKEGNVSSHKIVIN